MPVLSRLRARLWTYGSFGFGRRRIAQPAGEFAERMNDPSQAPAAARRVIVRAFGWLLVGLAGAGLAIWLRPGFSVVALVLGGGWLMFSVFTLYFFRDPNATVPADASAIVAPAHGLVDCVEETTEPEFIGGPCRRLSIFLSVFDVHVQNAPVAGRIAFLRYQPGQFLSALRTDSARHNENMLIGFESSEAPGERIAVRQIAGLIARRVVTWARMDDRVSRGQRLGLIQYGSRCDLYLPLSAEIVARSGDRVVAGETVVARRRITPAGPSEGLVWSKTGTTK